MPGVMTSLLQEIISVYTLLNPSQLTAAASNRVCNALALLQCVASHNETRALFLNGIYIYILHASLSRPANLPSPHPTVLVPVLEHHL
jgi:CCR4-NOT transcription complex subunit 9